MALSPGTRLGAYEILSLLGAGGMGEVYRATDTVLKRQVALKVLPPEVANDPDRVARFQREAEVLAALNHPNIAHLYGVETSNGTLALLLELVEGETVADRIVKGPIPLDEALPIAKQIADALEAAHEQGIIHRDLKPANIKVRDDGTVKVLDFGLAKALEPVAASGTRAAAVANSPTITSPALMTGVGVLLGTAAYMAPEQAKGRPADKRSDVWAFGCVLYEMLTGERAFKGEDVADTLAQVLTKEPDVARAPRQVQRLLRRCLEKDPRKRLRDIGEVPFLIDSAPEPSLDRRAPLVWVAVGLALVFFAAATALALVHFREAPRTRARVQFQISPPEGRTFSAMSFSPDGRRLAFVAYDKDNRASLWVHSLDSGTSRQLVATIMGASPFWSPDSEAIGFTAEDRVKTITVSGGLAQTVCALPPGTAWGAGAWNSAGIILFGNQFGSLYSVQARGGQPTAITALDATRQETGHTAPSFLPDGRHFLYMRRSRDPDLSGVYVGSLDTSPNAQPLTQITRTDSNPQFAPLIDRRFGSLLMVRDGTLLAQRFDVEALEVSGQAIPIVEQVSLSGTTYAAYTASSEGSVALRTSGETTISRLTMYDRRGNVLGYASDPDVLRDLSLSPDGTRIAVDRSETRGTDIHLLDIKRGTNQRLTTDPEIDRTAVWSPEGNRIVFSSGRDGAGTLLNLYLKNADSSGKEELLLASPRAKYANSWSHDGYLLFSTMTPGNRSDLMYLTVDGDRTPKPYVAGPFNESQGQFSPDGRWVAYTSDESGTNQVYLSPFPNPESKTTISNNGGFAPRWAPDGNHLYYISQDLALMEVDMSPSLGPGIPRSLFTTRLWGGVGLNGFRWDVAPGGHFIIGDALDKAVGPPITVVLNWTGALDR